MDYKTKLPPYPEYLGLNPQEKDELKAKLAIFLTQDRNQIESSFNAEIGRRSKSGNLKMSAEQNTARLEQLAKVLNGKLSQIELSQIPLELRSRLTCVDLGFKPAEQFRANFGLWILTAFARTAIIQSIGEDKLNFDVFKKDRIISRGSVGSLSELTNCLIQDPF